MPKLINPMCLKGACDEWQAAAKEGKQYKYCERCGFRKEEDEMRKAIPLTMCEDGLRRKLIPDRGYKKPAPAEQVEPVEAAE